MSVRKKLGIIIVVSIVIVVGCLVFQNTQQQYKVQKGLDQTVTSFTEKSEEDIQSTLTDLSQNISEYMVSLESSIEASMLNAAYYLQETYDHNPNITNNDLKELAKKTGVSDLLITNEKGEFILATDPASLSVNLFDIWDGYRDLLKEKNLVLPTNLKISAESGNIVKYIAIPRKDGAGCIEAALNSDSIKETITKLTQGANGFSSFLVVDSNNTVLIRIGEGADAANYVEGKTTNDEKIKEVFSTAKENMILGNDRSAIYYPIKRDDKVTYVMKLTVENAPYFENANTLSQKTSDLITDLKNSLKMGVSVSILILVLMATTLLLIINHIMKPIVVMANLAKKIADGDLNVSVSGKQDGEIGTLIDAFNSMTLDLKAMLMNVKQTSTTIKDSSSNIRYSLEAVTHSSNEISNATEEISKGTFDLAQDNSQVYENTSALSTHLENMIVSIEQVNDNILDMEQMNKEGIGTLTILDGHFIDSMDAIQEVENKIETLQEKSKSISLIVDTIGSIATQTNLLALNASIEAARAGEHGKGFAVVAEEVRKLAELSTQETQGIGQIIKEIIAIVESTNQKMTTTRTAITETNVALANTKEMFQKLNSSTEHLGENSHVITESIRYVSNAKTVLLNLVENISAISEESAAASKEVSESTIKQAVELEDISKQIQTMDVIVDELNELVEKYRIE